MARFRQPDSRSRRRTVRPVIWPASRTWSLIGIVLLAAVGVAFAGFSAAANKPAAKTAKVQPPPEAATTGTEPPPPDPTEMLRQETQAKFDEQAKALAELSDRIDKVGQDARVNAKTIGELKDKLEENAILVYKHLARGISGAEKVEQLSKRLDALESTLRSRGNPRTTATGPLPRPIQPVVATLAGGQLATAPKPKAAANSESAPKSETLPQPEPTVQPEPEPPPQAAPGGEPEPQPAPAPQSMSPSREVVSTDGAETKVQEAPPPTCQGQGNCRSSPESAGESFSTAFFDDEPSARIDLKLVISLMGSLLVLVVFSGLALLEMAQLETWAVAPASLRNLVVAAAAILVYPVVGHGLTYGTTVFDVPVAEAEPGLAETLLLYRMALALLAVGVVAAILSDRLSLPAYFCLTLLFTGVAYPFLGQWTWGGHDLPEPIGNLHRRGFHDFAGATVIHAFAAWFALGWLWRFPVTRLLAPEEPGKGGDPRPNQAMVSLGVFLLWLGWFGLAMGPQAGDDSSPVAPMIVNTLLAGAAALVASLNYLLVPPYDSKAAGTVFARVSGGTVAGLVAVSAGVDRVLPMEAIAIGALAGLLHPIAYGALTGRLIRKDQAAANLVAAHGVCGTFGTLCVGFFGSPGVFAAPSPAMLGSQCLGVLVTLGFGLGTGLIGAVIFEGFSKLYGLFQGE